MAVNPDTSLPNRHRLVIGATGAGKSQLIRELIPASGVCLLGWDTDEDHPGHHYASRAAYAKAVAAALRSGRPFRLLWAGANDLKTWEWWCGLAFAALDGRRPTELLVEELADVSPTAGKASPAFGELIRRARKYNGGLTLATQRGTEISKTVYTQCAEYWIGRVEATDLRHMERLTALPADRIAGIDNLHYVRKRGADVTFHRLEFHGKRRYLTELTD
ncbi:ATP-binding protein [Halomonas sp. NO4]|uniref:ATP-binding protein n=1 Tax=Halomonas sp. NO4 TaxID=2484813 RepID=UPI0013D5E299|nr:ATP-binding protein [Halomonas sp. NO4]